MAGAARGEGLRERDNHPIPKSVTTPEAFYEVMAAAALDAIDLQALLERVARAERELETTRERLRQADIEAESARHVARPDRGSGNSRRRSVPGHVPATTRD